MNTPMSDLSRLRYDLAALALALAVLAYGLARGGGFHPVIVPMIVALAAVYVWIERGRARDLGERPARSGPRRLLIFAAVAVGIVVYSEVSYSGSEAGDEIVVFSGVLIAASLTSLYLATRPGPAARPQVADPR